MQEVVLGQSPGQWEKLHGDPYRKTQAKHKGTGNPSNKARFARKDS